MIIFSIRTAAPADALHLIAILETIAAEQIYTAITKPWSAQQQEQHITELSSRETIHLAENTDQKIIGYQTLELWAPTLESMSHVGQVGTFISPASRGTGIGTALFQSTAKFATQKGYKKFVIQVRASNVSGQSFYKRLGFTECGRLTRQVLVGTQEDDEILMEFFL